MKDNAFREQFLELRAQGKSFASIAIQLNVAKGTLVAWSKDMKDELGNMRQIQLEAMREKYRLGAERRMELFSRQLEAVEGELSTRPLSTVPTDRLFDMMMKLTRELATMETPLTFKQKPVELVVDDIVPMVAWEA